MRPALRLLPLICIMFVSIFPLWAQNALELIHTYDSGEKAFDRTYQLDETHYLSCIGNTLRVYEVGYSTVNLVSEAVGTNFLIPAPQLIDNQVYALAEGDGVYVYRVTPEYQIVLQHIIPVNPLYGDHHYSLYLLDTKMIVQSVHYPDLQTSTAQYYLDFYDITNEQQPVHLNRFWMPDNDLMSGIVQCANSYYFSTFNGLYYYSADLITVAAPLTIPGITVGSQAVQTCFEHDGNLYFYGYANEQAFVLQCSILGGNNLSLDWSQDLVGYKFCDVRFEFDRVILVSTNPSGGSIVSVFSYSGDTWQLDFTRYLSATNYFFPITDGYLCFYNNMINRYTRSFLGSMYVYGSSIWQIEEVFMNRYVVMKGPRPMYQLRTFDLRSGTYIDPISGFRLNKFANRWNKTELLLRNGQSCRLLSFDDNGYPVSTDFSLGLESPYSSSAESKWGNRILCLIATDPGCMIRLLNYENGTATPLSTWPLDYSTPGLEFYGPNHFYTNQREPGNQYMHFYRINNDYSITLVASISTPEPYACYQGPDHIFTSGSQNCVIDISNPDSPFLLTMFSMAGNPNRNISYNGDGHYLFGGTSPTTPARVVDSQGEALAYFYANLPWYVSNDYFVLYNAIQLCVMEHPKCVGNEDEQQIPALSPMGLPYPNPFREICQIPVSLKETGELKLSVYNLKGQKVQDIETATLDKGGHLISWDGRDKHGRTMANGVYILRLQTREGVFTQRMVLLK